MNFKNFISRFDLADFVVVADSGLMNKSNIALLESSGYKYIIGARIKSESKEIKKWLLSLEKKEGVFYEQSFRGHRLIVGYTDKRAKNDKYNREKGIRRLQKEYKSGNITKENINKRASQALNKEKQNYETVMSFKRTFYDINNRDALDSEIVDNLKDKMDMSILLKTIEQINKAPLISASTSGKAKTPNKTSLKTPVKTNAFGLSSSDMV